METCYPQILPHDRGIHCPGACSPFVTYPRALESDLFFAPWRNQTSLPLFFENGFLGRFPKLSYSFYIVYFCVRIFIKHTYIVEFIFFSWIYDWHQHEWHALNLKLHETDVRQNLDEWLISLHVSMFSCTLWHCCTLKRIESNWSHFACQTWRGTAWLVLWLLRFSMNLVPSILLVLKFTTW